MTSVLFESHHLYYLPHFLPIMAEFKRRGGYRLASSIPRTVHPKEQARFAEELGHHETELISGNSELARVQALKGRGFDVIIVGNVGQLHEIAAENSLVIMVYHGIGLKQTYYRDSSPRVNLRAVECQSRLAELRARGYPTAFSPASPCWIPSPTRNLESRLS